MVLIFVLCVCIYKSKHVANFGFGMPRAPDPNSLSLAVLAPRRILVRAVCVTEGVHGRHWGNGGMGEGGGAASRRNPSCMGLRWQGRQNGIWEPLCCSGPW